MNVGLIARSEDRGLGVMTWAFHRHMRPAKTLLIQPTPNIGKGFPQHHDRFPDAIGAPWDGGELDEATVRGFLDGLDVVYTAETFYDPRLPLLAAEHGVATVQHAMPEFFDPDLPAPTMVWLPTPWRADTINAPIVPVPVEAARPSPPPRPDAPLRFLHIVGHRAMADRNGTLVLLQALRTTQARADVTVLCQDRRLPTSRTNGPTKLRRVMGGEASLDPMYEACDVVLMPRRYGGLCLPAQEALSFGKAVVMPTVSPNDYWPTCGVRATMGAASIRTVAGDIGLAEISPRALAQTIDALAADPSMVAEYQYRAYEWAARHTWDAMRPTYSAMLAEACARVAA